jgi:hypothetical protein
MHFAAAAAHTTAALQLRDASGLQLQFTAPSYLTGSTKLPYAFGPTLRLRAGGVLRIRLVNDLLQAGNITMHQPDAFAGPMDTNLHTHGLWDANGGWQLRPDLLSVIIAASYSQFAETCMAALCPSAGYHCVGYAWHEIMLCKQGTAAVCIVTKAAYMTLST